MERQKWNLMKLRRNSVSSSHWTYDVPTGYTMGRSYQDFTRILKMPTCRLLMGIV